MSSAMHYSSNEVLQYELSARLLFLTEDNTYTLNQVNGQRIFRKAPHAWSGPEPSRNCEVFIGRIPHDCFEDTLVPLFQQAGELFEFRLMINFSGNNRGYAFAMYTTEAGAANAIRIFDNYMIRPCWQLGVCPSVNNCRIYISCMPNTMTSPMIVRMVYSLTEEVQEVRIRRGASSCSAIVEYKSHRGAAMARKALVAAATANLGFGCRPTVDWSTPLPPQFMRQYKEVGRITSDNMVEIGRVMEEPVAAARGGSYPLERASQARRLRAIHEAQRNHQHQHRPNLAHDNLTNQFTNGMESLESSMSSLSLGQPDVWSPPPASPAPPNDFNPWTTRDPFGRFMNPPKDQ